MTAKQMDILDLSQLKIGSLVLVGRAKAIVAHRYKDGFTGETLDLKVTKYHDHYEVTVGKDYTIHTGNIQVVHEILRITGWERIGYQVIKCNYDKPEDCPDAWFFHGDEAFTVNEDGEMVQLESIQED